jgi:hypothetical protein
LPDGSFYDVSETVPAGWLALTPTSHLFESPPQSGASYSFTFINSRLGSITIIKEAYGKSSNEFRFTGDLGNFTLLPGGSQTFSDLLSGSYMVAEDPTSFPDRYWTLLSVTCVDEANQEVPGVVVNLDTFSADIPLEPGQHLTCTFLNERADLERDVHRYYLPLILK